MRATLGATIPSPSAIFHQNHAHMLQVPFHQHRRIVIVLVVIPSELQSRPPLVFFTSEGYRHHPSILEEATQHNLSLPFLYCHRSHVKNNVVREGNFSFAFL